jgi:hypothetical protein
VKGKPDMVWIIDYCRYQLGVDTGLKTQADIEMCRKKIADWEKEKGLSRGLFLIGCYLANQVSTSSAPCSVFHSFSVL